VRRARYDPLIAANNANSKSLLPRHGRLHFTLGASSAVLRPEPLGEFKLGRIATRKVKEKRDGCFVFVA
jgi:hypothetical protein